MLSEKEYQDITWKLDNIPASITGIDRQRLRTTFRKKLHEHDLASKYPKFQPLHYEEFFINYRTDETTLIRIIEAVKSSKIFTLDTESVGRPYQRNVPALIQTQIILPNQFSYVTYVEVHHLPHPDQPTFKLIQQLFEILFRPENKLYIWGEIKELESFVEFNLFTWNQMKLSTNKNLQMDFKTHWNQNHRHKTTSTSSVTDHTQCTCETCLGINPNNPWSLQNAVAYALNQWLDKRHSRSPFDMGLDPQLKHLNSEELAYRELLTQYAADDCLSMHQILIYMNLLDNEQQLSYMSNGREIIFPILHYSPIIQIESETSPIEPLKNDNTSDITQENSMMTHLQERSTSPYSNKKSKSYELESISSSEDDSMLMSRDKQQLTSSHRSSTKSLLVREELSVAEKKKLHNRRCTVKQRKRLYTHEIIHRGIDRRFTITKIKKILREHSISFCAINISKSSLTSRTSLYIGIKDPKLLSKYENKIRKFFTTDHYNELYSNQRQSDPSDYRRYRHRK